MGWTIDQTCNYGVVLAGPRDRLDLSAEQQAYAVATAQACRAVWNVALEQRQIAAVFNRHQVRTGCQREPTYASQCHELADKKSTETWLADAPAQSLQRWGIVKLPKLGEARFRWTRPLAGTVRNATMRKEGEHWFISFCVETGEPEAAPNGLAVVGVDRGIVNAIATSHGERVRFHGFRGSEERRLKRLQRRLARLATESGRRRRILRRIGRLVRTVRHRRCDFAHKTAHGLTSKHGIVVVENLRVQAMTRSARGTPYEPGRNICQQAGRNRAILDKVWGQVLLALKWHGRKNGCAIVSVPCAYTSQMCSSCGHIARESRESQADFRCVKCSHYDNSDVNTAMNILAAGLAVTGRGDLGVAQSTKRQPPDQEGTHAVT